MKVVHSNDVTDVLVGDRYGSKNSRQEVMLHHRKMPDQRAEFAKSMIIAWGIVAARPAVGMEPQDKRELTVMPPKEVVERACEMASLAYDEFVNRGWMLELPSFDELAADDDPRP